MKYDIRYTIYGILLRACMALFLGMVLLLKLPACASVEELSEPEKDPQIVALQQELDRITRLNTTTQQKVEDIYNRVFSLQAKVDSLEANLEELVNQPAPQSPVTVTASEAPAPKRVTQPSETKIEVKPAPGKRGLVTKLKKASVSPKLPARREYERAYETYTKQRFDKSMALFKRFLQRYPKHDLADNAQYWIGEIYYDMADYPNAILAFKEVITHYPERSKAPDALLKIGYSYVALDDPINARIHFKIIIKNYAFSEAEAKARAKLKELENH